MSGAGTQKGPGLYSLGQKRAEIGAFTVGDNIDKFHRYGVREFVFYEDNFLIKRDQFRAILEGIVSDPGWYRNLVLIGGEADKPIISVCDL